MNHFLFPSQVVEFPDILCWSGILGYCLDTGSTSCNTDLIWANSRESAICTASTNLPQYIPDEFSTGTHHLDCRGILLPRGEIQRHVLRDDSAQRLLGVGQAVGVGIHVGRQTENVCRQMRMDAASRTSAKVGCGRVL